MFLQKRFKLIVAKLSRQLNCLSCQSQFTSLYPALSLVSRAIESVQDCLIKLEMKPCMHLAISRGNKHFFTKSCHCQTYQNYEQSRQKLGTILGNKVS